MPDFNTSILGPESRVSILMPEIELMTEPSEPLWEERTSAESDAEGDESERTGLCSAPSVRDLTANVLERVTVATLGLLPACLGVFPALAAGGGGLGGDAAGRLDLRSRGCFPTEGAVEGGSVGCVPSADPSTSVLEEDEAWGVCVCVSSMLAALAPRGLWRLIYCSISSASCRCGAEVEKAPEDDDGWDSWLWSDAASSLSDASSDRGSEPASTSARVIVDEEHVLMLRTMLGVVTSEELRWPESASSDSASCRNYIKSDVTILLYMTCIIILRCY